LHAAGRVPVQSVDTSGLGVVRLLAVSGCRRRVVFVGHDVSFRRLK